MNEDRRMQELVNEFATSVIAQTEAIRLGDHKSGNRVARRYIAAFEKLRAYGDVGRDSLASLLTHESADVRTMSAAFLLRHKTGEALDVLRAAAAGDGIIAFEASEAIKRWEEGTWSLDPG